MQMYPYDADFGHVSLLEIAYVGNDPLNYTDPTGECSAAAGSFALGASAADGPIPAGEAIGAGVIAGNCAWKAWKALRAWRKAVAARRLADQVLENELWDEPASGPFEQDDVGKIKDIQDVDVDNIDDDELLDAERQLEESIERREEEQSGHGRGSPNGNDQDRENDRLMCP